jgi:hypothetical protein
VSGTKRIFWQVEKSKADRLSAAAGSKDKEGTVTPLQQALQQVLRESGGWGAMGRGVRGVGGGERELSPAIAHKLV